MKKLAIAFAFCFFSVAANAQLGNVILKHFAGVPTGPCQRNQQAINDATGDLYTCLNGSWHAAGTSTGTGTVTAFSSGSLSPLFTTGVANASTTPALSFTLSTTTAHTFFGNPTGSTTAPTFTLLGTGDIPDLSGTYAIVGRNISTTNSLTGGGNLSANRTLQLVGDAASPGVTEYYGTDGSGTKGWYSLPSGAVSSVFGRSGSVTATSGDYTAAQVTNAFDTSNNNALGAHYFDITQLAAPANPAATTGRLYFDSGTGLLACLNSAGASCLPTAGGGSVSSVFGRTGAITSQTGDYTFAQIGSTPTTLAGYGITDAVPSSRTVNGKALSSNITLGLASADFVNQGTTTTVYHGNAAGNPSFGSVVNADIAAATIDLTTKVTGILPAANGGNGNGFFAVSGPASSVKTFTFPNVSSTVLTSNAAVTVAQGGTGTGSTLTGLVRGGSPFTAAELSGDCATSGSNAVTCTALHFGATGIALGTAPSSGQFLTYNGTNITGAAALSNPMTTLGDIIYGGAAGAATQLTGPTATNGVAQFLTSTPSGGAATAPVWAPGGIVPRASTCTANADTLLATDRGGYVSWSDASPCAVTLPQAGTTGFASNYVVSTCDIGAGTATITPTTSTISYSDGSSYTAGASSMQVSTGQCAVIYSDNTNYTAILRKINPGTVTSVGASFTGGLISIGGTPVTSSGTLGFTVAGTSGGIPYFSNSSTWASSAALTSNSLVLGGGAGSAPKVVGGITSDGTSVLTLGVAGTSVGGLALNNATSGTLTLKPPTGALGTVTVTVPAATDTLVNLAGTQALTGKTLDGVSPTTMGFVDATSSIQTQLNAKAPTASPTFTGTPDASGATQFKLPVAAAFASLANGEVGYDSTNKNWHLWQNGADVILAPLAAGFTSGDCGQPTSTTGTWQIADAGAACGSGGGLSGMTAGQVPIAATATTVTSSKALAGAGAGITTGPTSSTTTDLASFTGTGGQLQDSGIASGNVSTAASAAGAANQVVLSNAADKTLKYAAADTNTTHAMFATAGAPAFRALASTDLPAITLDKSASGLANPTADSTFTWPIGSTVGITLNGTAPASVATATGTNGSSVFVVTAPVGGADSNATGTAGVGGSPAITAGAGGAGTGTNAVGGAGGSVTLTAGNGGASLGTGVNANGGNVVLLPGTAGSGGSGTAGKTGAVQVGSSAPAPVIGTAGGNMAGEGTAPTGLSANDTWYANSTNHCFDLINQTTDVGCAVAVGQANTYGNFLQDFSGGTIRVPTSVAGVTNIAGTFQAGADATTTGATAAITLRGEDVTGGSTASIGGGAATLRGGDTASTGNSNAGGTVTVRGGDATGGTGTTDTGGTLTGRGGNCTSTTGSCTPGAASFTAGGFTAAFTNGAASDTTIAAGLGTGNAAVSHVKIQSPALSQTSGTTAQTQVTRYVTHVKAGSTTSATATTLFNVALANNQTAGFLLTVHVETTQATPHNCSTTETFVASVQDTGGTVTSQTTAGSIGTICDTGTLTLAGAFSAAAPSVFSITPTWATIVPTAVTITIQIQNLSQQDIALL